MNIFQIHFQPPTPPTKYHYYPHNQHPYFLPECAVQQVRNIYYFHLIRISDGNFLYLLIQVCNAVYVRLNYTQPLCVCPPR